MENVQSDFQVLDSFVSEFVIKNANNEKGKMEININSKVGFSIVKIFEKDNEYLGQIKLLNDYSITNKEKNIEITNIHIVMDGIFLGKKSLTRQEFEEKLKLKGAAELSNYTRAYIHSVTGLSGVQSVNVPIIDFNIFFKNAKYEEKQSDNK